MSRDYNKLLTLAYEIEGLLTLQAQRGDNAVVAVDELLAGKIAELASHFSPLTEATPTVAPSGDKEEIAASALREEEMMAEQPVPSQPEVAPVVVQPVVETPVEVKETEERPEETPAVTVEIKETVKPAEAATEVEPALTLEEKLARQRAKDLSRAFTLNDKFRFRRELFRGSQEELDDAINVISQMTTVAEAEEYVYDDLCLDPANEDVKAFMDIIVKHF